MKIKIDEDEWYPVPVICDSGDEVEVTEDEYKELLRFEKLRDKYCNKFSDLVDKITKRNFPPKSAPRRLVPPSILLTEGKNE